MTVASFTLPFYGTPAYYTGTGQTSLVPSLYPVAINGRPYMVDQKSGQFAREYEPRVRDSQDISTAPGEAAINPGGLWRRGQDSWHLGAGQQYADTAEAQDFRFYKSKGIDPWTKGQISLLNDAVLRGNSTFSGTNLKMAVTGTRVYVLDGSTVKYTTDPFATSPTWTSIAKGTGANELPNATPIDITSDGSNVYITYPGLTSTYGLWRYTASNTSANVAYGHEFGYVDFVKGFFITTGSAAAGNGNDLYFSPTGNVGADDYEHPVSQFEWIGSAAGQNAIYIAGYNGDYGSVYKLTIQSNGTLDTPVLALELPREEYPTSIHGYLGFILLGTNKGVRFCSTDNNNNLVAGSLIPTSGAVKSFASSGRFVWFAWTNYDGTSSGLGRLDLSAFTAPNTPAYATDLMYGSSTAEVQSVAVFNNKLLFSISGVGIIAENASSLVASGTIELGTYRWGIPDRKFVAKVDVRSEPLKGSVTAYLSNDEEAYDNLGVWATANDTENTYEGSDAKTIEAKFKLDLTRSATVTEGPVVTRWMTRAYVAPFRSQLFTVPVLLHNKLKLRNGREIPLDVQEEQDILDDLLASPRIVSLQIGQSTHSVIVEDIRWVPVDAYGNIWDWEGTAIVSMRSVEN